MTTHAVARRVGSRSNVSPANNASWLIAVGILAVAIPANEKIAQNEVFFAAHGVSPLAWVVLLALGLVVAWAVIFGLLSLLHKRLGPTAYDVSASLLMLVVTWFLVGNALSLTLFAGAPVLGPIVGLLVAAAITLLARRFAMGTVLVAFAGVAAMIPLVGALLSGGQEVTASSVAFEPDDDRPNILWVVADELSYPAAFDQDGQVRPTLPNLAELAGQATTYTKAYSAANYTDYAVPAMLSGISDVAAEGSDRMQEVRSQIGIIPGLSSEYAIVMKSPIYSFDCDSADCAASGTGDQGPLERYLGFAADTAAIAGKTVLAEPFSGLFPSLDGKWRDFWAGGDEFGSDADGSTYGAIVAGIEQAKQADPNRPFFAFWHTIRTHAPWVVDANGARIYPSDVPVVEGAHLVGAEANQSYTTDELKRLERRLWALSVQDADRQLGEILDALKQSGQFDNTMIVFTADHGAAMTDRADRRVGDTELQRWSEVAHVPLVVKMPGQSTGTVVDAPRSTGQIAASILAAAGGTPTEDVELSADLGSDLADGPVFSTVAGGTMTPWRYEGAAEVDPWLAEDLAPQGPFPFAVGLAAELLGGSVPGGSIEVDPTGVAVLPGESDQQVVIVDRSSAACPTGATVGMVSVDGRVVGSVLWEGPTGSIDGESTRGWAIVPKQDPAEYAFWCEVPAPQ